MSEAGQIFAMLRSSSAAELAKRFNSWGDSGGTLGAGTGGEGDGGPTGPSSTGGTTTSAGKGASGAGNTSAAQALAGNASEPATTDPAGQPSTGTMRAFVSLGHLAAPRTDLARLVAGALMSGLGEGEVAGRGTTSGAGTSLAGLAHGAAGPGARSVTTAGEVLAALATAPGGAADADVGSATGGPLGAESGGAAEPGALGGAWPGRATEGKGGPGQATQAMVAGAKDPAAMADPAMGRTGSGPVAGDSGGPTAARAAGAAQAAVFAEALAVLLDAAGNGKAGTVASGVIFNAAMMPGWPFPSAMARDGADGINAKAMLHRLAAAMEGMTPQQAAEYMAKIGGGHVLLRSLRKILKELDMTGKDEVKGLLLAFLETISTIAAGLKSALQQMSESAALQAAVVHGEDPDDGDRPGRRRLRL